MSSPLLTGGAGFDISLLYSRLAASLGEWVPVRSKPLQHPSGIWMNAAKPT